MIYELARARFERVRPLFEAWRFNNRVNSIIDGFGAGKIYVDDVEQPRTAIVWGNDLFYLAGDDANRDFNEAFNTWIDEMVIPAAAKVDLNYFAVQVYPLERWERRIKDLLKHRNPETNHACKHTFDPGKYRQIERWKALPDGFSLCRVDREMLDGPHGEVVLKEIKASCTSVERFIQEGIGFCVRQGKEAVSCCLSVYVSGSEYEIGIWTYDPQQRNRGFATLAAKAYIDHCLANDLTPIWTADEFNAPSLALAKKLGFEKVAEYPDFYFDFW